MSHGDDAWIHTLSILLTRYERSLLLSVLGEESDSGLLCEKLQSSPPSKPTNTFPPVHKPNGSSASWQEIR